MKALAIITLASITCALVLGLLDHETESLAGLFGEPGNIAGLLLWSLLCFLVVEATRHLPPDTSAPDHGSRGSRKAQDPRSWR